MLTVELDVMLYCFASKFAKQYIKNKNINVIIFCNVIYGCEVAIE